MHCTCVPDTGQAWPRTRSASVAGARRRGGAQPHCSHSDSVPQRLLPSTVTSLLPGRGQEGCRPKPCRRCISPSGICGASPFLPIQVLCCHVTVSPRRSGQATPRRRFHAFQASCGRRPQPRLQSSPASAFNQNLLYGLKTKLAKWWGKTFIKGDLHRCVVLPKVII